MLKSLLSRVVDALVPEGTAARLLVVGALVDSFGSGLFGASSTLYFVGVKHFPATSVAIVLSAAAVCGLVSAVPVGRLADRFGAVRIYVPLVVLRGAGYASYAFVDSVSAYAALTCLLYAADRGCSPLLQVIVAGVCGDKERTRALGSIRAVRNVGITGGLFVAGIVLAAGSRAAYTSLFLMDGLTYAVLAVMVPWAWRMAETTETAQPQEQKTGQKRSDPGSPIRNSRFMLFTVSNGVLMLYDTMITVLLSIWLVQRTDLPVAFLPGLLAVNTVLTVVMQIAISRWVSGPEPSVRLIRWTGPLMVAACALFAVAEAVPLPATVVATVTAVLLLTIAENLHSVASWELSYAMAPPSARARYLGAFSMGVTTQKIVGPTLLVTLLLPLHAPGWVLLAALFAAASFVALRAARAALLQVPASSAPVTAEPAADASTTV
ncbi:MFS transporter [Streptomyces sp. NPDC007907]|uniref:MFS transporter n=1 Tax=Streptomyces sp. NPDC007907 TaxID=3364789 RepID=UPI0036E67420